MIYDDNEIALCIKGSVLWLTTMKTQKFDYIKAQIRKEFNLFLFFIDLLY